MVEKEATRFTIPQFIGIIIATIGYMKLQTVGYKKLRTVMSSRTRNIFCMLLFTYLTWVFVVTGEFPIHSLSYRLDQNPDMLIVI